MVGIVTYFDRKAFEARKIEYRVLESVRSEALQSRAFWHLFKRSASALVFTVVSVVAVAWVQDLLDKRGFRALASSMIGTYTDVMLGIASMGAVFIGLYYAAISAIAVQAYSNVPANIRVLLATDLTSRTYMRLLTFTTCFALAHLGLQLTLEYASSVAVLLALVLGALSVVVFVLLGNRAFQLLDPTSLTNEVLRDLTHNISHASRGRLRSANQAFQAHARLLAEAALGTLEAIAERSMATSVSKASTIPGLCRQLLGVQLHYVSVKPCISPSSKWFPSIHVQRRWFTTSESVLSVAAETGTSLFPESRTDTSWLESRCDDLLVRILTSLADPPLSNDLLRALGQLAEAQRGRARKGDAVGGIALWGALCKSLMSRVVANASAYDKKVELLAVVDGLASIPVSIAIGVREYMDGNDPADLTSELSRYSSRAVENFPFKDFPFHLAERLEWVNQCLAFENLAEGSEVTPLWYRSELLRQSEAKHMAHTLDAVLESVPAHYDALGAALAKCPEVHLEAAVLERRLEYAKKASRCIEKGKVRWAVLIAERRVDGLYWPKVEESSLDKRLLDIDKRTVDRMATLCGQLGAAPTSQEVPDFEGRFLVEVANAIFEAAAAGDCDRIERLFPGFVSGSTLHAARLQASVQENAAQLISREQLGVASVYAQLLDVSGYLYLFSVLRERPEMWTSSKLVLDACYKPDVGRWGTFLTAVLNASSYGTFGIPHMSGFRHRRHEMFEQQLAPLIDRSSRSSYRVEINHSNELIRMFGNPLGPEGLDIFAFVYVIGELGVPAAKLGYKVQEIENSVNRASAGLGS